MSIIDSARAAWERALLAPTGIESDIARVKYKLLASGGRKATSTDHGQGELPMSEIVEMEQSALNRPVHELNLDTRQSRVKRALGTAYMGIICSHCGSDKVIRAGACGVCTQCGTSQGCS